MWLGDLSIETYENRFRGSFIIISCLANFLSLCVPGGWWRGDFGCKKKKWFPANHVEEIDTADPQAEAEKPLGNLHHGATDIAGTLWNMRVMTKIILQLKFVRIVLLFFFFIVLWIKCLFNIILLYTYISL